MTLKEFLSEAKRKTFASPFSIPRGVLGPHRSYTFEKGPLRYVDEYSGILVDKGVETVSQDGQEVWKMEYAGGMHEGYEKLGRRTFRFLKRCLRDAPDDFPIRGPPQVEERDFAYTNNWEGDITQFAGEEKIFFKEDEVYSRTYSGGVTQRGKSLVSACWDETPEEASH